MVDRLQVEKKLKELKKNLKLLYELRNIPYDDFTVSLKDQWAVFYGLQISIQIIIDIGNHILASLNENQIEEYSDIIDKLGKREIIPESFAGKIIGMPGLRNILVHEYGIINTERIYEILQNNLNDFEEFELYIKKYLEKE
ncbi:MAG: DUF86 domain-containing protein [Actinobacteria bacterium]|nr:DUF86 domain-containing protein [Actinomycetota bacterium]